MPWNINCHFTAYDSLGLFRKVQKRSLSCDCSACFCKIQAENYREFWKNSSWTRTKEVLIFGNIALIVQVILSTESIGNCLLILKSGYTVNTIIKKKNVLLFAFGVRPVQIWTSARLVFSLWHLRKKAAGTSDIRQPRLSWQRPRSYLFCFFGSWRWESFFAHLKICKTNRPLCSWEFSWSLRSYWNIVKRSNGLSCLFRRKQLMVQEKTRYVHCQEVNGLTIKREKWLRGVYSFVILSVGAPIFVVANQLQNSYLLILTIGVLCLIVCCIPKMGTFAAFFASNDRLFVLFSFEDIFHIMDLTVFVSYRGILPSIPR